MYTVYMHVNKINGKKYFGQTKLKVEYRWRHGKGYETQVLVELYQNTVGTISTIL